MGRTKRGLDPEQGHLPRLPNIQHRPRHTVSEGSAKSMDAFIYLLNPHGTLCPPVTTGGRLGPTAKVQIMGVCASPTSFPHTQRNLTQRFDWAQTQVLKAPQGADWARPTSPPRAEQSREHLAALSPELPQGRSCFLSKHTRGPRRWFIGSRSPRGPGAHTKRGNKEVSLTNLPESPANKRLSWGVWSPRWESRAVTQLTR